MNENGEFLRNNTRLVRKGYTQEEGIDNGENFSPIARQEGAITLLSYETHKGLKIYHMGTTSTFLNGIIEEEVYIEQPKGFIDPSKRDAVYKLHKALYGLKQAPRA